MMDPAAPNTRDTITFTVRVKNIGQGSSGVFKTAFYIVEEAEPIMLNIPTLSAGSTYYATHKVHLKTDQVYTACAFADSSNDIFETYELNNVKSIVFSVSTKLIAHYPLKYNGNDTLGLNKPMTLNNTPFVAGGIVCNGVFSGTDRCNAITPQLSSMDLSSFTIKAEFKVNEFSTEDRGTPVFVGGNSYRWIGFILGKDSTIHLRYNNSNLLKTKLRYQTGKWYTAKVTYDGVSGACYLDDTLGGTVDFVLNHNNDKNIGITNLANSTTFKGVIRNLHVSNNTTGAGPVVAYYPLMTNAEEVEGRADPMTLINTPFVTTGQGVICSGIYSGGTIASTPILATLDHNSFSIKFRFSISEKPQSTMPVMFLSQKSRSIGFQIEPTGTVSMLYNNSNVQRGVLSVSLNKEHEGEIIYDSRTGTGKVLVNNEESASASFTMNTPSTSDVTTANYSNVTAFKGIISDIRVYSR